MIREMTLSEYLVCVRTVLPEWNDLSEPQRALIRSHAGWPISDIDGQDCYAAILQGLEAAARGQKPAPANS